MEFKEFEANEEAEIKTGDHTGTDMDMNTNIGVNADVNTDADSDVQAQAKAKVIEEATTRVTSTTYSKTKTITTTRGKVLLGIILVMILVISYKCITSIAADNNKAIQNATVTGDIIGISPKVTGEVIRIEAQVGKQVKKGEVLYILDEKELLNKQRHAEAMLEIAKTELDKAVGGARIQEIVAAQTLVLKANADYGSKIASRDSVKSSLTTLYKTYNMLLKQMKNYIDPQNGSYDSDYAMKLLNNRYSKKMINDTQFTIQAQIIREQFQFKSQLEAQLADLKGQLRSSNANIDASKAAVQNAESQLTLVSDGVSNKDMSILVSKVKAAKIDYDMAKAGVDQTKVRAPQDGTILQLVAHKGEMAVPGKPVLYIADLGKLYIRAFVDEKAIGQVKLGQIIKVKAISTAAATATATATVASASPSTSASTMMTTFNGTITEIGVSTMALLDTNLQENKRANKFSQTVPVKITFDNKNKRLIIGMDAEIDME